jgi:Peptide methionine sulfoxide reductase
MRSSKPSRLVTSPRSAITSARLEEPDVIAVQKPGGVGRGTPDIQWRHAKPVHVTPGAVFGPQELLRHRERVISTRVGYTGGDNDNPTACNHPGHAEAVEVIFDPERTSYRDILEFFFQIHRPDLGEGGSRESNSAVPTRMCRSEGFRTSVRGLSLIFGSQPGSHSGEYSHSYADFAHARDRDRHGKPSVPSPQPECSPGRAALKKAARMKSY